MERKVDLVADEIDRITKQLVEMYPNIITNSTDTHELIVAGDGIAEHGMAWRAGNIGMVQVREKLTSTSETNQMNSLSLGKLRMAEIWVKDAQGNKECVIFTRSKDNPDLWETGYTKNGKKEKDSVKAAEKARAVLDKFVDSDTN